MKNSDVTVVVNPNKTYQTVNGFGTSACWWAQYVGNSEYEDDIVKLLYSKDGLGLNIYRYNVGGGEKDNPQSCISGSRATESFYYYNENTGKYEYDFSRDENAQNVLDNALSYGCIDTVVLFANSPHYSMTVSGQATGGLTASANNLPEENYEKYADYFLTITKYFLDKGVPIKYISPVNEPQWSWGGDWVGQEGCHYDAEQLVALYKVFAKKLKDSGLDVKLMAPESGAIGEETENYFSSLCNDEDIADVLGSLAYHSYWSDDKTLEKKKMGKNLIGKYADYTIDMTEWCELPCKHSIDSFEGALLMARVISQDLSLSDAESWSSWVGVNGYSTGENGKLYSDGMITANEDMKNYYVAQRYYAMAHFSKFIPSGSVRIYASTDVLDLAVKKNDDGSYTSLKSLNISAYKTPEDKTVLVMVNEGKERYLTFDMLADNMEIWTSTEENQMQNTYSGKFKRVVEIPENSITTFVFE